MTPKDKLYTYVLFIIFLKSKNENRFPDVIYYITFVLSKIDCFIFRDCISYTFFIITVNVLRTNSTHSSDNFFG